MLVLCGDRIPTTYIVGVSLTITSNGQPFDSDEHHHHQSMLAKQETRGVGNHHQLIYVPSTGTEASLIDYT
jgi:hypothetical protein